MYVSKTHNYDCRFRQDSPVLLKLNVFSAHLHCRQVLFVRGFHYPCGRIKLVCYCSGMLITGSEGNTGCDVTFDSVRSLYNVPGLTVLTDPVAVYSALGMTPYACK